MQSVVIDPQLRKQIAFANEWSGNLQATTTALATGRSEQSLTPLAQARETKVNAIQRQHLFETQALFQTLTDFTQQQNANASAETLITRANSIAQAALASDDVATRAALAEQALTLYEEAHGIADDETYSKSLGSSGSTNIGSIRINDGVTDQYLLIENFAWPTGDFTYELSLASTDTSTPALLSYLHDIDNELLIYGLGTSLQVAVDGRLINAAPTVNPNLLLDGTRQQLTLTFDSGAQQAQVFFNGTLQGTYDYIPEPGTQAISGPGDFVIGQELDGRHTTSSEGFSTTQILDAEIFDIRIYDSIRTVGEIAGAANRALTAGEVADPNLVAYFDMELSGTQLINQAGAQNMEIVNVAGLVSNDTIHTSFGVEHTLNAANGGWVTDEDILQDISIFQMAQLDFEMASEHAGLQADLTQIRLDQINQLDGLMDAEIAERNEADTYRLTAEMRAQETGYNLALATLNQIIGSQQTALLSIANTVLRAGA